MRKMTAEEIVRLAKRLGVSERSIIRSLEACRPRGSAT